MANEKDFQQRVQRIGALVQEIESIADPAVRASTTQLVQLIMEFHGTGLDRTLEILANAGGPGMEIIDQLGRDPMVSSLLVLYGLHPDSLETRVTKAVERLEPKLRKDGAGWNCWASKTARFAYASLPASTLAARPAKLCKRRSRMRFTKRRRISASLSVEGLEGKAGERLCSAWQVDDCGSGQRQSSRGSSPSMAANYGD